MNNKKYFLFDKPGLIVFTMNLLWLLFGLNHDLKNYSITAYWKSYLLYIHLFWLSIIGILIINWIQYKIGFWDKPGIWVKIISICCGYSIYQFIMFYALMLIAPKLEFFDTDIEGSFLMTIIPVIFIYSLLGIIIGCIYTLVKKIKNIPDKS